MYRAGRSTAANLRWVALAGQVASTVLGYQVYSKYQRQADEVSAQQAAGGPVTARMDLQKTKLFTSGALSVAALVARWSAARIDNTARGRLAHAVWWHNREIRGE
jgi:uncharacterized membrane protein YebE (DUF533 family)